MSDVQQGENWWLASDGKWYPPQSRPAPPPPPPPPPPTIVPPPPPVSPYAVSPTPWGTDPGAYPAAHPGTYAGTPAASVAPALTGWLQGLLWSAGALAVIAGVLSFVALDSFDHLVDVRFGAGSGRAYDDWAEIDDAASAATGFLMFLWVAVFVLTVVWMHKAHKATQRLWPWQRQWSPGWTVGGWFIPFAQFVIPKLVMNEIERIATAPRSNGTADAGWKQQSTSVTGWLWWIGAVVSLVLCGVGLGLTEDIEASTDEMRGGYITQGVGLLIAGVSFALGALFFRRLGRRLSPTGIVESP